MKTINFSSAYWHEIESKLLVYEELTDLLKSVNIKDFSDKFDELLIIFQCFPADIKSRKVETFKKMRRKMNAERSRSTKTLELYLVLDYERIMQGSDSENLLHIKEVFVKGCETFLKPMKGFDWENFEKIINR